MIREQQILLPRPKPGPGQSDRCLLAAGGKQPCALVLNCLSRHLACLQRFPGPSSRNTSFCALEARVFLACKINASTGLKTGKKRNCVGCCSDDLTGEGSWYQTVTQYSEGAIVPP